jgi:hypothetical protein
MGWAGHVAGTGERRGAYRVFVRNHDGKRPFGRPSRRRDGNIKMDLKEVEWWSGVAWSGVEWSEVEWSGVEWSYFVEL